MRERESLCGVPLPTSMHKDPQLPQCHEALSTGTDVDRSRRELALGMRKTKWEGLKLHKRVR